MIDIYKISEITQDENKAKEATNHVYMVDCSLSMHNDLPLMREHLKNLSTMVCSPGDTISIVYFSGKRQFGTVVQNVELKDISTITKVHNAIDRYLKPIGLTGFAEPMTFIKENVIYSLPKKNNFNFIMLTDGSDNVSGREKILNNCESLSGYFDSMFFIEYGYYCNRELLKEMSIKGSAVHVFSEGFEDYRDDFNTIIDNNFGTKISINVSKNANHIIYSVNGNVIVGEVENGEASISEQTDHCLAIGDNPTHDELSGLNEKDLYLIALYGIKTNQIEFTWDALKHLGDVKIIDMFNNAFNKEEMIAVEQELANAYHNEENRFENGRDTNYMPDDNAYTVLEFLSVLKRDDNAALVPSSTFFTYKRGTKKREVNESEDQPIFNPSTNGELKIQSVVYNSERPNISLQVNQDGKVLLPENEYGLKKVPSRQTRNYTVVKDGLLNIKLLPVVTSVEVYDVINAMEGMVHCVIEDKNERNDGTVYYVVDLSTLPMINRNMINFLDYKEFATAYMDLQGLKAVQKVLKGKLDSGKRDAIKNLREEYGDDAANWLDSIGVRDYGFSPVGTSSTSSGDTYTANVLKTKAKGLSSLPAITAVEKKQASGKKLTISEEFIHSANVMVATIIHNSDTDETTTVKKLLSQVQDNIGSFNTYLSNRTYIVLIGKQWFKDQDTYGEAELVVEGTTPFLKLPYKTKVSTVMEQKEIKL